MFPPFPMSEGGSRNPLMQMLMHALAASQQQSDDAFDEFGPLSESDQVEWKSILDEHNVLKNQASEIAAKKEMLDGRRKLFWAKLENSTGILDKNMRITDDFRLLVEKDKPVKRSLLDAPDEEPSEPKSPDDQEPLY